MGTMPNQDVGGPSGSQPSLAASVERSTRPIQESGGSSGSGLSLGAAAEQSTLPNQDFVGPLGSQPSLGASVERSTGPRQDFGGLSSSQLSLGASADWSTHTNQDFGVLSSCRLNLAALSYFHIPLTRGVSRNAYGRIHLAELPDYSCTGQIFQGASGSLLTLERMKGEHRYVIPSTVEVPQIHVATVFPDSPLLYVILLNSLWESWKVRRRSESSPSEDI